MKELLTYIAQSLVDHPEQVEVTEQTGDGEITLELRVAPEDMGKVLIKFVLRFPLGGLSSSFCYFITGWMSSPPFWDFVCFPLHFLQQLQLS